LRSLEAELSDKQREQRVAEERLRQREAELAEREIDLLQRELNIMIQQERDLTILFSCENYILNEWL
jgi:hypothetical protein